MVFARKPMKTDERSEHFCVWNYATNTQVTRAHLIRISIDFSRWNCVSSISIRANNADSFRGQQIYFVCVCDRHNSVNKCVKLSSKGKRNESVLETREHERTWITACHRLCPFRMNNWTSSLSPTSLSLPSSLLSPPPPKPPSPSSSTIPSKSANLIGFYAIAKSKCAQQIHAHKS